jgi:hypothetical protein
MVYDEESEWDYNAGAVVMPDGHRAFAHPRDWGVIVPTPQGYKTARYGWWIVKSAKGQFSPCAPEFFAATYVPAETPDAESPAPVPAEPGAARLTEAVPAGASRVEQDAAAARTLISGALLGELGRRLGELESALDWQTSCTSCARFLDVSAAETFRREAADAKLAELRSVLLEGGQEHGIVRRRALGIIGSEGEADLARHLVAQAKAADAEYKVAAARVVLYEFLHQYEQSELSAFRVAIDLASSLRKIIDDLDGEEGSGLRQRPGDQRLPVPNGGPSMHDLVAGDVRRRHPGGRAPEIAAVTADLAARKQLGLDRYGSLLQAGNGRDALRDLHEEQLDALVYCRQWLEENDEEHAWALVMRTVYRDLLTGALTVRRVMDDDPRPCQCHDSFAAVSPTHPGHCCFLPADQDCHREEVEAWERGRDQLLGREPGS